MIYEKFNAFIKEKYFKNIGTHVVLSVDHYVIDEFCQVNSISEQQLNEEFRRLFSEHWDFALKNEKFFGLAAIQVYVAHLMEDEHSLIKDISASNYRERLSMYLQINDSALNKFFKTDGDQDKLWGNLKNWAEKNDFNLGLPEKNEGPWSKVRYPLSQSLLNQQDLKYLPNLYRNAGLNPYEQLCLHDFIGLIEKVETNISLQNHLEKIKTRLKENEILLYKQIFEHYSSWDGTIIFEDKIGNRQIKELSNNSDISFLVYNLERQEIQIFNNQSVFSSFSINSPDIFLKIKKHFRMPHNKVLFFTQDDYHGDWVFSRYLVKGEQNLMISTNDEAFEYLAKKIDDNCHIENKLSCVLALFEINENYEPNSSWEKYFSKISNPVKIMNGLKLDRKRWMFQAGPDLFFSKPIDAWVNGERITTTEDSPILSLRYCETGLYILKLRGFSPIRIEIDSPIKEKQEITKGWRISKKPALWEPNSEPFQICGLVNSFSTEQDSNSEIRDWINANVNENKKEHCENNTLITNAINRAKYGIRH